MKPGAREVSGECGAVGAIAEERVHSRLRLRVAVSVISGAASVTLGNVALTPGEWRCTWLGLAGGWG